MTSPITILVVEDEEDIQHLITYNLLKAGYQVHCAGDGESALKIIATTPPSLIILDLMLPGMSGLDVCRQLRDSVETINTPVLMLTAKSEDEDILAGFDAGTDDYLPKPFSPQVLAARVAALLRRVPATPPHEEDHLTFAAINLSLDLNLHECLYNGTPCGLTSSEFAILQLLTSRPGWVYSRQQIIDSIHGFDYCLTSRAIDVQISGLRKKLGHAHKFINTVRGVGYRFSVDV